MTHAAELALKMYHNALELRDGWTETAHEQLYETRKYCRQRAAYWNKQAVVHFVQLLAELAKD